MIQLTSLVRLESRLKHQEKIDAGRQDQSGGAAHGWQTHICPFVNL